MNGVNASGNNTDRGMELIQTALKKGRMSVVFNLISNALFTALFISTGSYLTGGLALLAGITFVYDLYYINYVLKCTELVKKQENKNE